MKKRVLLVCSVLALTVAIALSDTYPRQPGVDAVHYVFRLSLLTDESNEIHGEATVQLKLAADGAREVFLDLTSPADGKGMTVSSVMSDGAQVQFTHQKDRLRLPLPAGVKAGQNVSFTIQYRGVPAEGLRLIPNIHGERTAFSENWPNRARQWLPMIDHPYDKATGEFIVTTSAQYQVVANGLLIEERDLPNARRLTHWKQSVPIASWLYAIGVARFAAHHAGMVKGIPLQSWVFPQDRERGFALFESTSRRAIEFFSENIGPYSYEKLANVQAAGLNGGTEHATAIFYGERGVSEGRGPVVHEIAHQWWGNAVTERDWDDVWLSEGFATYFTLLFTEHVEGRDAFVEGLKRSRNQILQLEQRMPDTPVIHRNLSDMRRVLNQFVYQKGGWTLHMLRGLIGTEAFWNGIREYYRRYQNRNASTEEFRQVMEDISGKDLSWFFRQWLTRSGVPKLTGTWRYDASSKSVHVSLTQSQEPDPYRLWLGIGIVPASGTLPRIQTVDFNSRSATFTINVDSEPAEVVLDPGTSVLMEPPQFSKERLR
ncbi:MAG: M1 family metallopeptidase [Acidobacteria bacterium]|nr:M1 family metallopeptidase [Acidobacteriota bacterium]